MLKSALALCHFFVLYFARSDITLKQMVSNFTEIFKESRKHWFSYVTQFQYNAVETVVAVDTTDSLASSYKLHFVLSERFVKHKTSEENYTSKREYSITGFLKPIKNESLETFQKQIFKVIARKVSGQLFITGENFNLLPGDIIFFLKHTWKLELDPRLRANISFQHIRFATNKNNSLKANIVVSHPTIRSLRFKYHGFHPAFNLYPLFRKIRIKLIFESASELNFSVEAQYTVIDARMLHNILTTKHPALITCIFIHQNIKSPVVLTFHIQVEKTDVIVLQVATPYSETKLLIFDGPGSKSKLKTNSRSMNMSSFQCLVQTASPKVTTTESYVMFSSYKMRFSATFQIQETSLEINTLKSCNINPCVLSVSTKESNFLNVTMTKLNYFSNETLNCNFGAFLILENNVLQHNTLKCESYDSLVDPASVYSRTNNLILLLYWYTEYTKISAHLKISPTKCVVASLEFCAQEECESKPCHCTLSYYHTNSYNTYGYFDPTTETFLFLHHHNEQSSFDYCEGEEWSMENGIQLTMAKKECFVIQVRPGENAFAKGAHRCLTRLFIGNFESETLRYTFSGTFLSHILFRGQVRKLCKKNKCSKKFTISHPSQITTHSGFQQIVVEADSPQTKKDDLYSYFYIQFKAYFTSKLWFDIRVEILNSPFGVNFTDLSEVVPTKFKEHIPRLTQGELAFETNLASHFLLLKPHQQENSVARDMFCDKSLELGFNQEEAYAQKELLSVSIKMPLRFLSAMKKRNIRFFALAKESYLFVRSLDTNPNFSLLFMKWLPVAYNKHFVWWGGKILGKHPRFETRYKTTNCEGNHQRNHITYCYNVSLISSGNASFVVFYLVFQTFFDVSNKSLSSWKDASGRCRKKNGSLPSFSNNKELETFLQVYHEKMEWISEGIFTGLKVSIPIRFLVPKD